MQRNPHSYQIATGYRTFYSLSLIYQLITKNDCFFIIKILELVISHKVELFIIECFFFYYSLIFL